MLVALSRQKVDCPLGMPHHGQNFSADVNDLVSLSQSLAGIGSRPTSHRIPPRAVYPPVYGRVSAGGVCPGTNAGVPCEVMVTVAEVRPGELAVMTLVPE